jgi:hypothetical protein
MYMGYSYWVPKANGSGYIYPWYNTGPPWHGPTRLGDTSAADDVLMACAMLFWTGNSEIYFSNEWGPSHKFGGVLDNYNVLHDDGHVERKRGGEEVKKYASNWY